ncbi:MAG: hypothetical protein GWO08_06410, partial [Gammaproteobacteria bacterium]|nr:hypothetical protein [Gammaproteobacteria bacterium]NIR93307.1 hypothetical protein [Gammaproteobacteria bacterium]NIW99824.1 hypothetical protein [Phycisphaerae bacterium]
HGNGKSLKQSTGILLIGYGAANTDAVFNGTALTTTSGIGTSIQGVIDTSIIELDQLSHVTAEVLDAVKNTLVSTADTV